MQGDSSERNLPPGGDPELVPTEAGGSAPRRRGRAGRRKTRRERPLVSALAKRGFRWLGRVPFGASYSVGGFLGGAYAFLPSKARRVTDTNLALCFPEATPRERRALARRSLAETGRTTLELGAMWNWERERLLALVREVEGDHLVDDALARGRGVLLLTPHLGAWELIGLYVSWRWTLTAMYRAPHMGEMEEFYKRARERFGARLVPADGGGVRALHRALQHGEIAGILPDQDPGRGSGIFVPYFGVLANTTVLPARLAQRTGAAVVLIFAERLANARGFKLHFRAVSEAVHDPDLERATRALNLDVERCVREHPHQYLWSYKRFRIRPKGGAELYGKPPREEDAPEAAQ